MQFHDAPRSERAVAAEPRPRYDPPMPIHDIPTDETVRFITAHVRTGDRILEVGAGRGDVAQRLRSLGHSVVAIDSDANTVEAARKDGNEVLLADFLEFGADPFDAVVFSRSLHHLNPLTAAVEQAQTLLRSGGTIVIEDFAFDEMNDATADWLHNELRTLSNDGVLNTRDEGFGAELLSEGGNLATWKTHHGGRHEIHTATQITAGVERVFQITERNEAPYLYRYVAPMLPDDNSGFRILQGMLAREKSMIEHGTIQAIGRRLVAGSA